MKHIWQSIINENDRTFEIFARNCSAGKRMDVISIGFEPFGIEPNEFISFREGPNPVDPGKECA
jgi:hypothetical protein